MGILDRLDKGLDPIGPDIIMGTVEDLLNWGRSKSDWYMHFGIACCAIEFMAANAAHFDLMRFGAIPRPSPRQSDFMIISGTVTMKMAERIKRLYEQMAEPKYVLAMGSCANSGGPYWEHGYHVLKGVDRIIPVDVFVPGCPPRPEAFLEGMVKLQEKIRHQEIFRKREKMSAEDLKAIADRSAELEKQFNEFQETQDQIKE